MATYQSVSKYLGRYEPPKMPSPASSTAKTSAVGIPTLKMFTPQDKNTPVVNNWVMQGTTASGTPVWQRGGEYIATDVPGANQKGLTMPAAPGKIYYSGSPGWRPADPNATVIYVSGGKTTGQVSAPMGSMYSGGVFPGINVGSMNQGGATQANMSSVLTNWGAANKQATLQNREEQEAAIKSSYAMNADAQAQALAQYRDQYLNFYGSYAKQKYGFDDNRWLNFSTAEKEYYVQRFITDYNQTISQRNKFVEDVTRNRSQYAIGLKDRLAIQKPGIEQLKGTTLQQRERMRSKD
jgi:hypothetical protein